MSRHALLLTIILIVSSVAGGCGQTSQPDSDGERQALQSVSLLIDWKAEPTYAGFFIAKARGFYEQRGLDVEIVEGNGATTAAQLIGAGTYSIGSASGEATAIARSRGIPVKSLAVFYPDVPTVIYSRADTPIRTPADLIGKRIGIINGSITFDGYIRVSQMA